MVPFQGASCDNFGGVHVFVGNVMSTLCELNTKVPSQRVFKEFSFRLVITSEFDIRWLLHGGIGGTDLLLVFKPWTVDVS